MTPERARRAKLIACFAVIYLVWGSSYLAMKIGVQHVGPALFAGVRFALSGALLVALAALRGARLPAGSGQWKHVLVMGVLTVLIANGTSNWAIQWVPSNQSALLAATSAFWIAWFGTLGEGRCRSSGAMSRVTAAAARSTRSVTAPRPMTERSLCGGPWGRPA